MSAPTLAGLTGAALVGLGLYGLLVHPHPLRKLLGFNLLGSGVFLLNPPYFGQLLQRGNARFVNHKVFAAAHHPDTEEKI